MKYDAEPDNNSEHGTSIRQRMHIVEVSVNLNLIQRGTILYREVYQNFRKGKITTSRAINCCTFNKRVFLINKVFKCKNVNLACVSINLHLKYCRSAFVDL